MTTWHESSRVAYVTGGMGGIGTAICQRLHKDGFKVIAGCGPSRDHAKWLGEQKAQGYDVLRVGRRRRRLGFDGRGLRQGEGRARRRSTCWSTTPASRATMFLQDDAATTGTR